MNTAPQSVRKHIAIFGETNSGKSALFNAILEQEISIVSDLSGTTTDPVTKSMELNPFGPVVLIDTAGLNDFSQIGKSRIEKTRNVLERTDFALYTVDLDNFDENQFTEFEIEFKKRDIPFFLVITKCDEKNKHAIKDFSEKYKSILATSIYDKDSITQLKLKIIENLNNLEEEESFLAELVNSKGTVVMVVPIDSEAPKGRLILPQVQLIRDCLDNQITCIVTTEKELKEVVAETKKIDLVITDSQIFKFVSEIVPDHIKLTSFSVLMARKKGNLPLLIDGINSIRKLPDNAKILISEVCTHNRTHEDIGRVKIPTALKKFTGKNLSFDFVSGKDYPYDLDQYDLIIHCGGCMITKKEMGNRLIKSLDNQIPITNYGLVLALTSGIFNRAIEIFE